MNFSIKPFSDLTVNELFKIYKLRNEVFVVEQNCAYQDVDDKDLAAFHVMLWQGIQLSAYCRILAPGVSYAQPSIGRVAVATAFRKQNLGKELMKYSIHKTLELFNNQEIVISAQAYLIPFYTQLGFKSEGEQYPEDDIPHIKMRYTPLQLLKT